MTFTVIDRRTQKRASAHEVITELFHGVLTDAYGFAVDTDGALLVMDCSGNYVHLDPRLFTAEWTEET